MPAQTTIRLRQGTATEWTTANPVLASGEQGYEADTKRLKVGDGVSTWSALSYFASSSVTVSPTAPATSLSGDLWFDSTDGQTYIRYVDADSSQWVAVSGASATPSFQLGAITPWAANAIPSWALELTGQAVSRATYSGLFALLGTSYGAGDGTTTFNIPDYRGRTLVGHDASQTEFDVLGETGGAKTHTLTNAELPAIPISVRRFDGDANDYLGGSNNPFGIATPYTPGGVEETISNTKGGNGAHNNLQPYTVVKWIICAASSSGNFDTEVQTALVTKVSNTALSQNYIINGGMDIWQRGNVIDSTQNLPYSADRWEAYRGAFNLGMRVSRVTMTDLREFNVCARVQRVSGNTSTAFMSFSNTLETQESIALQGKAVVLSFYARAGANFSSTTSNTLSASIKASFGTDQNSRFGYTSPVTIGAVDVILIGTWQRVTVTGVVPETATQVSVGLSHTPVGTAGAADHYDITGVQLEVGTTATPFRRNAPSLQAELAACQRYYYRIAGGTADGGILQGSWYVPTEFWSTIAHPVPMRVGPTPSISGVFSLYAQGTNRGHTGFSPYGNSPTQVSSMTLRFTGTASTTTGVGGWAAIGNGNTGTFIQFDAEL